MHSIIADLNWRYATKKFDPSKKVGPETWSIIQKSLQLVPTSYGLQEMQFIVVESKNTRVELKEAAFGQSPITDASHLLIMCATKEISPKHIDAHINRTAKVRNLEIEKMQGYSEFLKGMISRMPAEKQTAWNSKQVYIALGQLLHTCAILKVDVLPMEGFDAAKFDDILSLDQDNLTAVVVCPIGYRHADDSTQKLPKVRKAIDQLFRTI